MVDDRHYADEYGFDGFIVSDWMDMEAISTRHRISENTTDAFFLSVDGGVDMHMHGPVFFDAILKLIKEGKLTEERVNKACAKILEAKFRLGLFENRYVTEAGIKKTVFTKKHQQTALEIARRSIVLLKNESLLPVDTRKFKKILVTGLMPITNQSWATGYLSNRRRMYQPYWKA